MPKKAVHHDSGDYRVRQRVTDFAKPSQEVSERMRRVRSRETGLERRMESILKALEVNYEKQPRLVGHPDFKVKDSRVVIFCDSSFWHGRRKNDLTGVSFRRNKVFWTSKIAYNKARDLRISRALRKQGWKVLRFWDTEIERSPSLVINRIRRSL